MKQTFHHHSNNIDEAELARQAAQNWDKYWAEAVEQVPPCTNSGFFCGLKRFLRRAGGLELAFRLVRTELCDPVNKSILEAGCGMGEMSLRLARRGNQLFVLDTSKAAVSYCRVQAEALGLSVYAIQGSIFSLPFRDSSFDFAFNIGVLDHFGPKYRMIGLAEVMRALKHCGRAVILTNSEKSILHPIAMKCAMRRGRWPFGPKFAIESLKPSLNNTSCNCSVREYSKGFLSQFEFLHYCISGSHLIRKLFLYLFYLITFPFAFLNQYAGQYLVSIIEKGHNGSAANVQVG